jgi:hypothetical protein
MNIEKGEDILFMSGAANQLSPFGGPVKSMILVHPWFF